MPNVTNRIERAFNLCTAHPNDSKILITHHPDGVPALLSGGVKALIYRQGPRCKIQRVIQNLSDEQIAQLHRTFAEVRGKFDPRQAKSTLVRSNIFNTEADAETIGSDIESRAALLQTVTENFRRCRAWFHGKFLFTALYHADIINVLRSSTVYEGANMKIVTGDLSEAHYLKACARGRNNQLAPGVVEAHYKTETLQEGDVLIAVSNNEGRLPDGTQQIVHITQGGKRRLYSGIDMYRPEYQ